MHVVKPSWEKNAPSWNGQTGDRDRERDSDGFQQILKETPVRWTAGAPASEGRPSVRTGDTVGRPRHNRSLQLPRFTDTIGRDRIPDTALNAILGEASDVKTNIQPLREVKSAGDTINGKPAMLRRIATRLKRLTYRQWAVIGSILVVAIFAAESWKRHRAMLALRTLRGFPGAWNLNSDTLGPKWLQTGVPSWFRDGYLTAPHTVWILAHAPNAQTLLAELRHIPTLRSLKVWAQQGNGRGPVLWSESLQSVGRLTQLRELDLSDTKVVDGDLAPLGKLFHLQTVELSGTEISDAGLTALLPLKDLTKVSLASTKVTDVALIPLSQWPGLEDLDLSGTVVTDDGLTHLVGLHKLMRLALRKTRITDRGLFLLSRLPALESIDLRETGITDAGLESLTQLTNLHRLSLDQTPITDAAIPHLIRLANLQELTMLGTQVTDNGFTQYTRARPNVTLPLPYR